MPNHLIMNVEIPLPESIASEGALRLLGICMMGFEPSSTCEVSSLGFSAES